MKYLVCPVCQSELDITIQNQNGEEIIRGELLCHQCSKIFPIIRSIPRLLPDTISQEKQETSSAFGWEWQQFRQMMSVDEYQKQFLDWIHPVSSDFIQNKVVLDAGCGMGRFPMIASRFGAKDVILLLI